MKLTERDESLLKNLNRYSLLSTKEIKELLFKNVDQSTLLRRLRKIEAGEFIRRVYGLDDGTLVWVLTRTGATEVCGEVPYKFINKNTLEHELSIARFRIALESMGLGKEWMTEREIRSRMNFPHSNKDGSGPVVPDGILIERHGGEKKSFSVELELTLKSHTRYERLFESYQRKNTIFCVWYVVKKPAIGEAIAKIWYGRNRWEKAPIVVWTDINDLLENKEMAKMNSLGKQYLLKKIFNIPAKPADHTSAQREGTDDGQIRQKTDVVNHENVRENEGATPPTSETFAADPSPPTIGGKGSATQVKDGGVAEEKAASELGLEFKR